MKGKYVHYDMNTYNFFHTSTYVYKVKMMRYNMKEAILIY